MLHACIWALRPKLPKICAFSHPSLWPAGTAKTQIGGNPNSQQMLRFIWTPSYHALFLLCFFFYEWVSSKKTGEKEIWSRDFRPLELMLLAFYTRVSQLISRILSLYYPLVSSLMRMCWALISWPLTRILGLLWMAKGISIVFGLMDIHHKLEKKKKMDIHHNKTSVTKQKQLPALQKDTNFYWPMHLAFDGELGAWRTSNAFDWYIYIYYLIGKKNNLKITGWLLLMAKDDRVRNKRNNRRVATGSK